MNLLNGGVGLILVATVDGADTTRHAGNKPYERTRISSSPKERVLLRWGLVAGFVDNAIIVSPLDEFLARINTTEQVFRMCLV